MGLGRAFLYKRVWSLFVVWPRAFPALSLSPPRLGQFRFRDFGVGVAPILHMGRRTQVTGSLGAAAASWRPFRSWVASLFQALFGAKSPLSIRGPLGKTERGAPHACGVPPPLPGGLASACTLAPPKSAGPSLSDPGITNTCFPNKLLWGGRAGCRAVSVPQHGSVYIYIYT